MSKLTFILIIACSLLVLPSSISAFPKIVSIGMSAILPGSGQISQNQVNRGALLLSADVIAFGFFIDSQKQSRDYLESYKRYSRVYAGAQGGASKQYYSDIAEFESSQEYNAYHEMRARNYFLISMYEPEQYADYISTHNYPDSMSWNWQNDVYWKDYKNQRSKHQETKLYANLFIGIMLLNRAISMLDTALIKNPSDNHTIFFSPSGNDGLTLNCQLEF